MRSDGLVSARAATAVEPLSTVRLESLTFRIANGGMKLVELGAEVMPVRAKLHDRDGGTQVLVQFRIPQRAAVFGGKRPGQLFGKVRTQHEASTDSAPSG